MDFWLYHPTCGYYRTVRRLGRTGDFFTAAHVGHGYGAAWAYAFARSLPAEHAVHSPEVFVELGAGDGRFLEAFLRTWIQIAPVEVASLSVYAIEGNPLFRARLENRLAVFAQKGLDIKIFSDFQDLPPIRDRRVWVFANEFLDAYPSERVLRRQGQFFRLLWCFSEDPRRQDRPVFTEETESPLSLTVEEERALAPLEEGTKGEIPIGLSHWFVELRQRISPELVFFVDYGIDDGVPWPREGTVRGYVGHQIVDPKGRFPGSCDVTYDVPWAYVRAAAKQAGFVPVAFQPLGNWLLHVLGEEGIAFLGSLSPGIGSSAASHGFRHSLVYLVHPEGMGERFSVLALTQAKHF